LSADPNSSCSSACSSESLARAEDQGFGEGKVFRPNRDVRRRTDAEVSQFLPADDPGRIPGGCGDHFIQGKADIQHF
jgi:hypothetical protein